MYRALKLEQIVQEVLLCFLKAKINRVFWNTNFLTHRGLGHRQDVSLEIFKRRNYFDFGPFLRHEVLLLKLYFFGYVESAVRRLAMKAIKSRSFLDF